MTAPMQYDPLVLFRRMYDAGLLNHDAKNAIELSDVEWLTPESIAERDVPDYWVAGLTPFAQNGCGDSYAWYEAWRTETGVPVAFCPHDEDHATGYAPHLPGAVYRLLLEEMASCWLADTGISAKKVGKMLRDWSAALGPFLPAPWAATLGDLSARPLKEMKEGPFEGALAVYTMEEAEAIIARDLAFEHLNESFKHEV